ncbi:hypothetical protein G3143_001330 [Salmonella enterica subsp. enterica serovar Javiana]|nr:hypothetical protein [Salmonella enterica subsp. enterica serovar Javiana]EEO7205521.1 hypothetical protein [Salmonella enterica subsp. enterica serovar Rubislaw]EEG7328419.1 hypothetical protein [Salmonella enterica subsp. enterica serovar Javiana]EEK7937012.1 hypothetical protein [Salmonella enterica subsp. enterica serovar Javiana]EEK8080712.1 hypothetical protein [Salmonella enterica subsp. enterica serovar Javiana]
MNTITREQLHERARRKVKELEFAITQSAFTSIRDGLEEGYELARIALASLDADKPELKIAKLINKFYERYPLASFNKDTDRTDALGYFLAGAELQCFGEFIKYEELLGNE